MAIYIRNCYCVPSCLFVLGGIEILSSVGTTQGDPGTMDTSRVRHVAFADDLGAGAQLMHLRNWWNNVVTFGPLLGYHPNASKSWLVVTPIEEERQIFEDTNIKVTTESKSHLGGYIGSESGKANYAEELIHSWCSQLTVLSTIAKSQPQAVYAGFMSSFIHELTYHIRTMHNIKQRLLILDDIVDNVFIPAITGGLICSKDEWLLSLPVKKGGLAIPIF